MQESTDKVVIITGGAQGIYHNDHGWTLNK